MSSSGPVTSTTRTVSVCILQRVGFFARFRVTQVQSLNNAGITPFFIIVPFLSFLAGNINNKKNKKQYNYRKDLIILRCCPSLSNGRFAAFFFTLFLVTSCCDLWVRSHVFVWL